MQKMISIGLLSLVFLLPSTFAARAEQPGIRCVQNQLNALGFSSGTPDGTIGKQTRKAAEDYRAWMSGGAGGKGWRQPALTALNGEFWCEKVGEAHPEVAKYSAAPVRLVAKVNAATFDLKRIPSGWNGIYKSAVKADNNWEAKQYDGSERTYSNCKLIDDSFIVCR